MGGDLEEDTDHNHSIIKIGKESGEYEDDNDSDDERYNIPGRHYTPMLYLLGLSYHPVDDHAIRREDESQHLTWFTYRCEFEEIVPYGIRSDAGWGCMFRSMQMLFGQALKIHYCGRGWKWPRSLSHRRQDVFIKSFLTWFADFPSVSLWNEGEDQASLIRKLKSGLHSWYSLHNMVAVGLTKYQVLPGEWLGPGSASYIIRDLCERHYMIWNLILKQEMDDQSNQSKHQVSNDTSIQENHNIKNKLPINRARLGVTSTSSSTIAHKPPPRVFIVQEGCIYRPHVEKLMTKDSAHQHSSSASNDTCNQSRHESQNNLEVPISTIPKGPCKQNPLDKQRTRTIEDPLSSPCTTSKHVASTVTPWDTSLLLLIPLRLGLKSFNVESYGTSLASTFQLPQSVGFVGGSPRHALWFYGALSDGSKLYGLDPHTVQNAPLCSFPTLQSTCHNPIDCRVDLSDEYLRTVQCPASPSVLDFSKIDPSLALGFLCRDRQDFEAFCDSIVRLNISSTRSKLPELFTISDLNSPNYGLDVDQLYDDPFSTFDKDDDNKNESESPMDDDEYVLL